MTTLLENINTTLAKIAECMARDPKRAERLLGDVKRWASELATAPQANTNAMDAARWRWATALDDNAEMLYSIVISHGGDQQKSNERADVYREAAMQQQSQEGK